MTAFDYMFEDDWQRYALICAALLREVAEMRAKVDTWPTSEKPLALRIARRLEDLDAQIHQLLNELVSAPVH